MREPRWICLVCDASQVDLMTSQAHAMATHQLSLEELCRATYREVSAETDTGGLGIYRVRGGVWTLPDGRDWLYRQD